MKGWRIYFTFGKVRIQAIRSVFHNAILSDFVDEFIWATR